eukprot:s677_g24.t1
MTERDGRVSGRRTTALAEDGWCFCSNGLPRVSMAPMRAGAAQYCRMARNCAWLAVRHPMAPQPGLGKIWDGQNLNGRSPELPVAVLPILRQRNAEKTEVFWRVSPQGCRLRCFVFEQVS